MSRKLTLIFLPSIGVKGQRQCQHTQDFKYRNNRAFVNYYQHPAGNTEKENFSCFNSLSFNWEMNLVKLILRTWPSIASVAHERIVCALILFSYKMQTCDHKFPVRILLVVKRWINKDIFPRVKTLSLEIYWNLQKAGLRKLRICYLPILDILSCFFFLFLKL